MRLQDEHTLVLQKGLTREDYIKIYNRYHKRLCLFALKFVRELNTAEDIVQEVFVLVWEKSTSISFEYEAQLESYLFKAVNNHCINFLKQHTNRTNHNNRIHYELLNATTDYNDHYLASELLDQIGEIMQELPEKSQAIFNLSRTEGLKNKQIADKLNLNEKSIEYHITKVLKHLKVKLAHYLTILYVLVNLWFIK